jgi:hypothetical protein
MAFIQSYPENVVSLKRDTLCIVKNKLYTSIYAEFSNVIFTTIYNVPSPLWRYVLSLTYSRVF